MLRLVIEAKIFKFESYWFEKNIKLKKLEIDENIFLKEKK
jgi:hypothetical protein